MKASVLVAALYAVADDIERSLQSRRAGRFHPPAAVSEDEVQEAIAVAFRELASSLTVEE
jgi:hypothetical protein